MFKKFYTTDMSGDAKALQKRFTKIRGGAGRFSKLMAGIMTAAILMVGTFAMIAAAAFDYLGIENGSFVIDGQTYSVEILHIDNEVYLNNDSYYVPLRQTMALFGYSVNYNVPAESVDIPIYQSPDKQSFPYYSYEQKADYATDSLTMQIYGATTAPNSNMPIIEVVSPEGEKFYCQIGCETYSNAWAPPAVIIDGTTYIPLRALAYWIGGEDCVQWDSSAHDTYYTGIFEWDPETSTVTVDHGAASPSEYRDALAYMNQDGRQVVQMKENRDYVFCLTDGYSSPRIETFMVIDKRSGGYAILTEFDAELWFLMSIEFDAERDDVISLYQRTLVENGEDMGSTLYGTYDLNGLNWTYI